MMILQKKKILAFTLMIFWGLESRQVLNTLSKIQADLESVSLQAGIL